MKKNSSQKIPVIVIFAPTASGKTALTRELFSPEGSHFILNAEIISADSMQVYKDMNIGTAKPDSDFCRQIPHHLIDMVNPDVQFSVADFLDNADELCKEIYSKNKIPVICGGTGFYIRSFLYGLPPTPVADEALRQKLKQRIAFEGNAALYEELKSVDIESAKKIHINDSYRICRALEVYYLSGNKRSDFKSDNSLRQNYKITFIVLKPSREVLYERIRKRVDFMIQEGLEKEINLLLEKGYTKDCAGFKAIGYSEWFDESLKSKEEIIEKIKHDSCKYAKKQYTYIKDIPGSIVIPFDLEEESIKNVQNEILKSVSCLK